MKNGLKKGDKLLEDCGCKWEVVASLKTCYRMRHLGDGDVISWDRKQVDSLLRKGQLVLQTPADALKGIWKGLPKKAVKELMRKSYP